MTSKPVLRVVAICPSCKAEREPEVTRTGTLKLANRDGPAYSFGECVPCVCGEQRVILKTVR